MNKLILFLILLYVSVPSMLIIHSCNQPTQNPQQDTLSRMLFSEQMVNDTTVSDPFMPLFRIQSYGKWVIINRFEIIRYKPSQVNPHDSFQTVRVYYPKGDGWDRNLDATPLEMETEYVGKTLRFMDDDTMRYYTLSMIVEVEKGEEGGSEIHLSNQNTIYSPTSFDSLRSQNVLIYLSKIVSNEECLMSPYFIETISSRYNGTTWISTQVWWKDRYGEGAFYTLMKVNQTEAQIAQQLGLK